MGQLPSKTEQSDRDGSSTSQDLTDNDGLGIARFGEGACAGVASGLSLACSPSNFDVGFGEISGQVARQTRTLHQLSTTAYPDFISSVRELNEISNHFLDSNGKQLIFAIKKGTDSTIFWKATVRVACAKVDALTKQVDSCRCLSLKQYLKVYSALKTQSAAVGLFDSAKNSDSKAEKSKVKADFDTNSLVEIDPNSLAECCICLERKPDVILPCTHSYCLPCIEQWNLDHKTCPVCRETLNSTEDGWVISEGPDALDVTTEIQKSLMNLAH